jgi:hypothetical protein
MWKEFTYFVVCAVSVVESSLLHQRGTKLLSASLSVPKGTVSVSMVAASLPPDAPLLLFELFTFVNCVVETCDTRRLGCKGFARAMSLHVVDLGYQPFV